MNPLGIVQLAVVTRFWVFLFPLRTGQWQTIWNNALAGSSNSDGWALAR